MRRVGLALVLISACLAACSGHPSQGDCEKTADKMLDAFAAPHLGTGSTAPSELNQVTESWRKVLKSKDQPTRQYLIDKCRSSMSKGLVECVLGKSVTDEASLAKCFSG